MHLEGLKTNQIGKKMAVGACELSSVHCILIKWKLLPAATGDHFYCSRKVDEVVTIDGAVVDKDRWRP